MVCLSNNTDAAYKTIELTKGLSTKVDEHWFNELAEVSWYALKGKRVLSDDVFYAARKPGRDTVMMHRIITGAVDGQDVDHINGDTLDNRECNLRVCSRAQNLANKRKLNKPTSSRFIGVCYDKSRLKWHAKLTVGYKQINIGRFETETEAAHAYNEAAKKHFGEFANLNVLQQLTLHD